MRLFILLLILNCSLSIAQTTNELVHSCISFIETLEEEEKNSILYKAKDSLRVQWSNLPIGLQDRPGVKIGDLKISSQIKLHELLLTFLSSQGYLKAIGIMQLDDIVNNVIIKEALNRQVIDSSRIPGIKALKWGYDNYFISIWNNPSMTEPWGIKFEGHHLSLNITIAGDDISYTPMFIGVSPATVPFTKYAGIRILGKEEDYGFKLLNNMSEEQKRITIISENIPKNRIPNPNFERQIDKYQGINVSDLTSYQKVLLKILIEEYLKNLEKEYANLIMGKIEASGIDNIYFAWMGSQEKNNPHYYIVNGPDFIIEYDNVGGIGSEGNHIHAIFREKNNDFGIDILKNHYLHHKH